ncbi:mitochondrial ribosomal small subunit component [Apophysomyces sp. BC1034]|nr:mitochondrial ribosomal small subunit component [Apophysomyces sp. BC1015]KAG0180442.1 mitochondrial ribosomal small subunit component [Apophysomyces sp. BC1021]KAG0187512.1 mitochondrial ribosomal small subunit component [Apophysomyces sp. BC1034]
MAYRPPPTGLARNVSNLIKANLIKQPPVWLPVLQAVPPGPSIIRSQNPEVNVSAQTALEKEWALNNSTTASRHKQKHLKTRPPRPRAIVYPEDKLRKQFYKDHPFELAKPKILVEDDSGLNRTDFSQLLLEGMDPREVDGETVIKYQLHLMTQQKMPERKAYAKATSEFYELRARQEERERQAQKAMNNVLETLRSRKWTDRALYLEQRALDGRSLR